MHAVLKPSSRIAAHRIGEPAAVFVGAVAGYVGLASCGYQLVGASSDIASFWPPNGLIVALLVLLPTRSRLPVLAAVLPGEFIADTVQGLPASAAFGWGTANIFEAAFAAWILVRVARRRPLGDKARDFVALAVAALIAPLAGALLGGAVSVSTFGGPYATAWLNWWLGDATGILLVVPLAISFAGPSRLRTPFQRVADLFEVGLVVGVTATLFGVTKLPLEFLLLPPLILLSVRHGLRIIGVASLSFAVTATICTGRGLGPLSNFPDQESRVIGLQAFIMTTAFVAFLVYATLSERRLAERSLTELATHDPLTGITNRREFMRRLEQVSSRRSRSSETAAIVYFDLDRFKEINDGLGHGAGDAVLAEVGRRLAAAVRDGDLVARMGGDEFAALLDPVEGISGAEVSARRIADAIEQPFVFGDLTIPIGISVGAALAGTDSNRSLAEADTQLYRDKTERSPRPLAAA